MKLFLFLLTILTSKAIFGQFPDSITKKKILNEIQNEKFLISYTYKTVPKFIKKSIKKFEKRIFCIVDKDKDFNSSDVTIGKQLPNKRIIYIAYSSRFFIITYEQGGLGLMTHTKIIEYFAKNVTSVEDFEIPLHKTIDDFKNILVQKDFIPNYP